MGGEGEADPVGRRSRSDARFVEARERVRPPLDQRRGEGGREREACGNINVAVAPEEEEKETVARAAARQSSTGVE